MAINVRSLQFDGVVEIVPDKFGDERGFFCEIYNRETFATAGIDLDWCQDNFSHSAPAGVLRGLHYQCEPAAQDKLVRVGRGSIFDVIVDIRHGSPTFGKWVSVIISAGKWNQVLIPKGFAHGLLTLEPDTEVIYKVTAHYSPQCDRIIRYDDPDIGIDWPAKELKPVISGKDAAAPRLAEIDTGFVYRADQLETAEIR